MKELYYEASFVDGKPQVIVSNSEKQVAITEAQAIEWHDEIEQRARELYPSTKRILSTQARNNMIHSKIAQMFR